MNENMIAIFLDFEIAISTNSNLHLKLYIKLLTWGSLGVYFINIEIMIGIWILFIILFQH